MLRIQARGEFLQVVRVLFSYNSWHSKEIALYRFLFIFTLTKLRCLVSWESPQNGLHGDKLPWKDANHDLTNKLKFQIFFFQQGKFEKLKEERVINSKVKQRTWMWWSEIFGGKTTHLFIKNIKTTTNKQSWSLKAVWAQVYSFSGQPCS